jgi:hypothetical protein
LDLARSSLPLEDLSSGPADELGIGPGYAADSALEFILQELGRFPGHGGDLLLIGLRSRVTRVRRMAVNALRAWTTDNWTTGDWTTSARAVLAEAARAEPNADLRTWMTEVLGAEGVARE